MSRREWFCSKCKKAFPSSDTFREHLFKKHKHLISDPKEQLEVLLARGARAMEGKQKCPLCQEEYVPKQLRSHLGRHLEQIALFILPEASEENEDSGSDHDSDDGNISTASDSDTKSKASSLRRRFQWQLSATEYFFKTGTRINAFDGEGYTLIHKAAKAGDVKRATFLLESGCDPMATTKDSYKMQPLHLAARNGHAEVVSVLLKQKTVNINTKDGKFGKTALIWACEKYAYQNAIKLLLGREDVIKLLLAREDVEVNAKDNEAKTALIWACQYGREGVVKLILAREDVVVNAKDNEAKTALMFSCKNGHRDVVKLLLAREDVEVNAKDNDGKTSLMWACLFGYDGVVELLLGRQDIIKLLLAWQDVEVNAKDNDGKTALMWTSYSDIYYLTFKDIARLLLDRKDIDVDAEDKDGNTALVHAASRKHDLTAPYIRQFINDRHVL
jgi:ankyrin repeat protein